MRHSITKRWVSNVTPEEKKLLVQEIPRYIKENCYYTDGSIKYFDLWLVGWVAAEFQDPGLQKTNVYNAKALETLYHSASTINFFG